jgi:hypothetical protein
LEKVKNDNNNDDDDNNYQFNRKKNDKKKKMALISYEGNEWKTRYENQEEINRHLERQLQLYQKKLDDVKSKTKNCKKKQ